MRRARPRRNRFIDLRRITLGDLIVLIAAIFSFACLFMPWYESSIPRTHGEWAFTYSPVAAAVVILFSLVTLFLVVYPAISPNFGLPPLPFSTPLIFLALGTVLFVIMVYQLGKYGCIQCQGTSRGFGLYIGLIASFVYIVGAVVKWASRPAREPMRGVSGGLEREGARRSSTSRV